MELFRSMDTDHNGVVTLEELRLCLESKSAKNLVGHEPDAVDRILERIDLNGDHLITWPEFRLYFAKPDYQAKVEAQAEKTFGGPDHHQKAEVAAFTKPEMVRTESRVGYKAAKSVMAMVPDM